MRWILIALIAASAGAVADAYVAIPWDDSKALYFPTVNTVYCYSVVVESEPTVVATDRCWPVYLPSVFVEGTVLMMNRPLDQLLRSCAPLNCVLRAMPDE